MPELTTSQIAYIIIAFIVLGVLIYIFIFHGYNPFRIGIEYGKCTNITREYCLKQNNPQECWSNFTCPGSVYE